MMITFKSDIGKRKKVFTQESFAHPAKMHLGMLLWIIGTYTKPGETILDPMFGSGSTMLAARYGRNVIGIELEQKFVDIAKGNWDKVVSLPKTKFGLGSCQIVQGDARDLEGLLVDSIITSPPYAGAKQVLDSAFYAKALKDLEGRDVTQENAGLRGGEDSASNISNLPYGKIDAVVTSPPYEATFNEKQHTLSGIAKRDPAMRTEVGGYSGKVDAVISSPPYEATLQGEQTERDRQHDIGRGRNPDAPGASIRGYTNKVDHIISSPPYEGSLQGDVEDKVSSGFNSPQAIKIIQGQARGYSKEANNIGNLRSDTYLEAMLKVYQQCYKVLKPSGLMILVTKDFIRKKQRVLLSVDTIALCEQAGFAYEDWHQRKLTQQSFWRTLYYQKHPEVEKLDTEDILVFRKLNGAGKVDVIVSSPPYIARTSTSKQTEKLFKGRQLFKEGRDPQQHSNGQIGDLPYDGAKVNDEWIKSRQGE